MFLRRCSSVKTIRVPSAEKLGFTDHDDPDIVTGSGAPRVAPVCSSIGMRQRSMTPPRSLEKYRKRPSGDHVGFHSVEASSVTGTSEPSATLTVHRSRWPEPLRRPQKAMRAPLGDQSGSTASWSVRKGRT